jgi:L-ascorbate metabolism protein UlaG (beta-lactamase superfamily)
LLALVMSGQVMAAGEPATAHYLGNEGVLVVAGESKILFDPLFRNAYGQYELVPEETERALFAGEPPFDGVDAVFVSHYHDDHFTPSVMLDYLRVRSDVRLYGPEQAVQGLRGAADADDAVFERVEAIDLDYPQPPVMLAMPGIVIEAVRIPHAGWPEGRLDVENIVYRVTLEEGATVIHMGDADPNDVHFERDAEFWGRRTTDMAFPPYWFFVSDMGPGIIGDRINTRSAVGVHVPTRMPDDPAQRPAEFDGVDLFTEPGETRVIRSDD